MGSLFATGAAKMAGWFDSSRPRSSAFAKLEGGGAKMSAKQRAEFLAREDAKVAKGDGLAANTPLSSRYA